MNSRQRRRQRRKGDIRDWFDLCKACETWYFARHRRRGGQPVPCPDCDRPMKRITGNRFMTGLLDAVGGRG